LLVAVLPYMRSKWEAALTKKTEANCAKPARPAILSFSKKAEH